MSDGRVIVGYESYRIYNSFQENWINTLPYSTYAEILPGSYVNCERRDILYIFSLIKTLALKAKDLDKTLRFI